MAATLVGLMVILPAEGNANSDLTSNAVWTFRAVHAGSPGPWEPTLAAALGPRQPVEPAAVWPRTWRTFVAWNPTDALRLDDAPSRIAEVPTTLVLGGISACRATLPLYTGGVLDLTIGHGAPWKGRWAWAFGELKAPRTENVCLAVEAAGPMTVWIDGALTLTAHAPGTHTIPLQVTKGSHVVAVQVESGAEHWHLTGHVLPPGPHPAVEARGEFTVDDPGQFASLTLIGPGEGMMQLNGHAVSPLLPAMISDQLPGVDASLLKPGRNVLTRTLSPVALRGLLAAGADGRLQVLGVRPPDTRITIGPVVSAVNETDLQIVIAADARVPAVLTIDGHALKSPAGIFHRWLVRGLKPSTAYAYAVVAGEGETRTATLRTLPEPGGPITIAVVGDPQSGKAWADVAEALRKAGPDLVVLAGDLVVDGLVEAQWRRTFLDPAAGLLASIPFRVVAGNHDRYAPLLGQLFGGGEPGHHWAQQVGGGQLVGIDGGADFSPGRPAALWLDRALTHAVESPIFVVSHYPAYSSRNHGKLADDGRVLEWTSRAARNHIVPILIRHHVTALFGGHDHGYERSELPSGLSAIVSGGGGAGTYPLRDSAKAQNMYSIASRTEHHYSLLHIKKGAATLRVLTPGGQLIDTRTWASEPAKGE